MSRIGTNWSVEYSAATNHFTLTYADTFAAQTFDADVLVVAGSTEDYDILYLGGGGAGRTSLQWERCTSPLTGSRTELIVAIEALDVGPTAEEHPVSVTDYAVTGTLTSATTTMTGNATVGGTLGVTGALTGTSAVLTGTLTGVDADLTGALDVPTIEGVASMTLVDQSSAASDPSSGQSVAWVSQGTTLEGDGDLMVKHNNGSTVVRSLLGARVPYLTGNYPVASGDLVYNGTSGRNMVTLTVGPGTWFLHATTSIAGVLSSSCVLYISSVNGTSTVAISEPAEQIISVSSNRTNVTIHDIVSPTSSTNYFFNFRAYGSSTAVAIDVSLGMTPIFTAFRIQ